MCGSATIDTGLQLPATCQSIWSRGMLTTHQTPQVESLYISVLTTTRHCGMPGRPYSWQGYNIVTMGCSSCTDYDMYHQLKPSQVSG